MRKPIVLTSLVVSAAVAASAAAIAASAAPAGSKANPVTATTSPGKGFGPARAVARPRARVYFKNLDKARHNAVEDAVGARPAFSSGAPTSKSFSLRAPSTPGRYSYICAVHGFMRGTLLVRR